jgi:hypothetical protein
MELGKQCSMPEKRAFSHGGSQAIFETASSMKPAVKATPLRGLLADRS